MHHSDARKQFAALRQRTWPCFALLALAACAQNAARPAQDPPSLEWTTEVVDDTIVVSLSDPDGFYRVENVTLVGPGGRRIEAAEISRQTSRQSGAVGPSVSGGVGVGSGGRSGVGIGLSFPIIQGRSGQTPVKETEARIRLLEPAAYRRNTQAWRIIIAVTDTAGNPSRAEIPAPAG